MGITYGSHDLVKRIIDGHNVEKVIYNGNQIWPSSPQPQPTYHIMGDFTNGSIPSGWIVSAPGGATYTLDSNGITWVGHQGSSTYEAGNIMIDDMPSLSWASRIVVQVGFTENNAGIAPQIYGSGNFGTHLLGLESYQILSTWIRGTVHTENISISNPYTGILTSTYNIFDGEVASDLGNLHYDYSMSNSSRTSLRNANTFRLECSASDIYNVTVSSIDFYVWNTPVKFDYSTSQLSCNVGDTIRLNFLSDGTDTEGTKTHIGQTTNLEYIQSGWTDSSHTSGRIEYRTLSEGDATARVGYVDGSQWKEYAYDDINITISA